jgi:ubiquinone/menaquinone biosynthesis C-methylase UbiE
VRRWFEKPEEVLGPSLRRGATALTAGCATAFFRSPLAEIVGPSGRVICIDLQERMISSLRARAARAGLSDRIETRTGSADSLGISDLEGQVGFALAHAAVREVRNLERFLVEIADAPDPGERLMIAESRGHVSEKALEGTTTTAEGAGLSQVDRPASRRSRTPLPERVPG